MIFGIIALLCSLACVADITKCLFLNDEPCMTRTTLIDMNPVKLVNAPEVVMSHSRKYMLQKKEKTNMLKHLI